MDIANVTLIQSLLALVAFVLGVILIVLSVTELREGQEANRRQAEAELDRRQEEARAAIFRLAEALAEEQVAANRAQQDMIRALYVAKGQLPPK